jgi:hypothetical protein
MAKGGKSSAITPHHFLDLTHTQVDLAGRHLGCCGGDFDRNKNMGLGCDIPQTLTRRRPRVKPSLAFIQPKGAYVRL